MAGSLYFGSQKVCPVTPISKKKYGMDIDNLVGNIDGNGVLQVPDNTSGGITFTGVEDIANYGLYCRFRNCTKLTAAVSFPDLTKISGSYALDYAFRESKVSAAYFPELVTISGSYSCQGTFYACPVTTMSMPKLTTVSTNYGCANMFDSCSLTSVSLPKLTTVSGTYGCNNMFENCYFLTTASLPELTTVSGSNGCSYMFTGCNSLSSVSIPKLKTASAANCLTRMFNGCQELTAVSFDSLDEITGNYVFRYCFYGCKKLTSVSFPALKTTSFGDTYITQLAQSFDSNTALTSGTCTVHFPSNLEATIQAMGGYPLFGGTSGRIVLSFDLPATS